MGTSAGGAWEALAELKGIEVTSKLSGAEGVSQCARSRGCCKGICWLGIFSSPVQDWHQMTQLVLVKPEFSTCTDKQATAFQELLLGVYLNHSAQVSGSHRSV